MSKSTLYCHREVSPITYISSYVGTYNTCNHVINGIIAINFCPSNCKVSQEELIKCEYYDYR